jgi:hypothetical protein
MATAYLDYLTERESFEAGPFVFTWFETNPEEPPGCRLCYSNRSGPYVSAIIDGCAWNRTPGEVSDQLVLVSDRRGTVLLMNRFEDKRRAAAVMRQAREAGAETDKAGAARRTPRMEEDTMSRYTFEGRRSAVSIVAGWDIPLATYFAQVWEGGSAAGESDLRLWVGAGRDRVLSVEALAGLLAPYGSIPVRVAERLEGDRERGREPIAHRRLLTK